MICHKCGYENKGGDKICLKCNALLDYHEIKASDIDTSGLALAEDETEKTSVKRSSKGRGIMMVVLGLVIIVGVAAAIFMPQQLTKVRAASILAVITEARTGIEAHVRKHRVWPASEHELQPNIPMDLLDDIDLAIEKGVIKLSIAEEPGKTAMISPSVVDGRVVWKCQNGGIGSDYLPLGCFK